jgi:hypothetical protein
VLRTFPFFSPENVFTLTQSRLQIPTDVLFTRLTALRPHATLTSADEALRSKLTSLENRLLYFRYGPEVLSTCLFCAADDPRSYLFYALPTILAPHLFNLVILAAVTSGLFTGKEGAIWRTTATFGAVGLALADGYFVSSYEHQNNSRAARLQDIDAFFWRSRVYRLTALAALDGLLGWMLYLSSTNRAFLKPPTTNEQVESVTRALEDVRVKLSAVGIMKNTVYRDEELRSRSDEYWRSEVRLISEAMEAQEVVDGVNNALESRLNMAAISNDAEAYAGHVVAPLQAQLDALVASANANANAKTE